MPKPYTYTGVVLDVHDGDSARFHLTADPVDIGFEVTITGTSVQVCRFLGYNSIELDSPGGVEARDHLAGILGRGPLRVVSVKRDKYAGRFDGIVYLPDGTSVADVMVADGYAARWNGRGPKPVPEWPLK